MKLIIATCPDCKRVICGGYYRENEDEHEARDRADWEAHGLTVTTKYALTVDLRRHAENCPRRANREV